MATDWTLLAEQRVYARPETDDDAKDALEWIAAQEGKTLAQLVDEIESLSPAGEAVQSA
jgi:hypothetical protein